MARAWWRRVLMEESVQCGTAIGVISLLECSEAQSIAQRNARSSDTKTRNIRMLCLRASRCNCRQRASCGIRRSIPDMWNWSCALRKECGGRLCLANTGSDISPREKWNGEMSGYESHRILRFPCRDAACRVSTHD